MPQRIKMKQEIEMFIFWVQEERCKEYDSIKKIYNAFDDDPIGITPYFMGVTFPERQSGLIMRVCKGGSSNNLW